MMSLKISLAVLCAVLSAMLFSDVALAEKRVALVIGNSAYTHARSLRNPSNDASDVAAALKKLGFAVTLKRNLTASGFAGVVSDFSASLSGADVALFWYAGHGLQYQKDSYLMPIDSSLKNEFSIRMETISVSDVISQMESQAKVSLLFLDACRNNILADALNRRLSSRGRSGRMSRGLGRIPSATGDTLIVYAAAPGTIADDGERRNSPFATAVLKHMQTPGLEIGVMLKRVRRDVKRTTNGNQAPEWLSRLEQEFLFKAGKAPNPGSQINQEKEGRLAYQAAKGDKERLELIIRHYGNTIWASYAQNDLKRLKKKPIKKAALQVTTKPATPLSYDSKTKTAYRIGMYHVVKGDFSKARKYLLRAEKNGHAEAAYNLASLYATGNGVKQSFKKAVFHLRKSSDRGYYPAMTNLGLLYAQGQGVKQNYLKAHSLWLKAAAGQHADAMHNLAVIYATGKGVDKDMSEAIKWYRKGSNAGYVDSTANLGLIYANGDGVTRDYQEAKRLWEIAAAKGHKIAAQNLEKLKSVME